MRMARTMLVAGTLACACKATSKGTVETPAEGAATSRFVALPGGGGGIGFDDLIFATGIRRVLAPAGATGKLDLIDPQTLGVTAIGGFTEAQGTFGGGHGDGTTSADEGRGLLFATDRTAGILVVVDPQTKAVVASAKLGGSPDYVRYVATTGEVWVTEPDSEQIEVFAVPVNGTPTPTSLARISVKGGPESLVIDAARKRAFTHMWKGGTVAVDVATRTVGPVWANGCSDSRGIALDSKRGFLFVGCLEGMGTVLDVDHDGRQLGAVSVGAGVDVIAYSASLGHVYLPGSSSATMGVAGVADDGSLTLLGTVTTASGAHCVTSDDRGNVWICDPTRGRLLVVKDTFGEH